MKTTDPILQVEGEQGSKGELHLVLGTQLQALWALKGQKPRPIGPKCFLMLKPAPFLQAEMGYL